MNDWKCTVKTPSNWLQTVYVEAYTHSDAVAFAEAQTGGKCIMAVPDNSYSSDNSSSSSDDNSDSSFSPGFVFLLLAVVFLVYAWKWILLIGIGILFIWFIAKYTES
jgi:hypothetical protein